MVISALSFLANQPRYGILVQETLHIDQTEHKQNTQQLGHVYTSAPGDTETPRFLKCYQFDGVDHLYLAKLPDKLGGAAGQLSILI